MADGPVSVPEIRARAEQAIAAGAINQDLLQGLLDALAAAETRETELREVLESAALGFALAAKDVGMPRHSMFVDARDRCRAALARVSSNEESSDA